MWTKKSVAIACLSLNAIVIGLILYNPAFLIVGIFFSLFLAIAFITTRSDIEVKRVIENPKIFEDDTINIKLIISNKGSSLGMVEIFDKIPAAMKIVEGSNKVHLKLKHNDAVEIKYSVQCPLRGFYLLGPTLLRRRDMFNLFCENKKKVLKSHITVCPKVENIKGVILKSLYRKVNPGSVTIRAIGSGTEFHNIRDYTTTDPFNKINWKVSARLRRLMVNQYELEDVYDMIIFIDAREITRVGSPVRNPLEYSIRAAATMANLTIKRTNRVGIVTYNDTISIIPPGSSETHMETILATLTGTYARGHRTFAQALEMATPYLTPKSPLLIISPLTNDKTLEDSINRLVSKKFSVSVLSPSSIDFEREINGVYSPKYLLLKLERQNRLANLRGMGAKVVEWEPDLPVADAVLEVSL